MSRNGKKSRRNNPKSKVARATAKLAARAATIWRLKQNQK